MKKTCLWLFGASLISLTSLAQPTNDNCAQAIQIPMGGPNVCIPITGNNTGATSSGITPGCAFFNGSEIWFKVTVPVTGLAVLETSAVSGGIGDSGMAAYSGSCDDLVLLDCDDDGGVGLYSLIELNGLTPGEDIYIAVWEFGGDTFGEVSICAYQPPPCEDLNPFTFAQDGCGTDNITITWETFSAEATYFVEYGPTGFEQGTGTTVSGAVGVDGPPVNISGLEAGTAYDFYVYEECEGVNSSTLFDTFSTTTSDLTNDDCDTAIPLTVGGINDCNPTIGFNDCASNSGLTHGCAFYQGGDVWFSFVAPAGGEVWVETQNVPNGIGDTGLAVYSGDCEGGLTLIGCNDDGGIGLYSLIVAGGLTPGETYYAAVWEYGNDTYGQFSICAYEPPTCPTPNQFSFFAQNIGPEQAYINWGADILPGAEFIIEYGLDGFELGTGTVITGIIGVDGPPVLISGLTPETTYDYYWQAACSATLGDSTNVIPTFGFTTTELCPTPFEFQIFTEDAGFDFITVSWPATVPGATFAIEYGPTGFSPGSGTVITGIVGTDGPPVTITGLTEATLYDMYLLQFCPPASQTDLVGPIGIQTLFPPPTNDNPCGALDLPTDGTVVIANNSGATVLDEESVITPPQTGCQAQDGWCAFETGIDGSVWFSFTATGTEATITTCLGANTIDTQIAAYSGTDCNDFGTLTLLGANDDAIGGCTFGSTIFASVLTLTGLTIGETYWVLVDGYGGATGVFAISITQTVGLDEASAVLFGMYPNPASTELLIQSDVLSGNVIFELFDINGRLISSQNKVLTLGEKTPLNISSLPAGIYSIRLVSEKGTSARRLIIE